MNNNRPVNLSLATVLEVNLKSPVAIASILHRLSGILLFFVVPGLLALLSCSLASPESFAATKEWLTSTPAKLALAVALSGMVYHLLAGLKHLVMDWGVAENLESGRSLATATLVASAFAIAGVIVWVMF